MNTPLIRITPWDIQWGGGSPPEPFPGSVQVQVLATHQVQLTMSGASLVAYDYNGTIVEDVTQFFDSNGVVMAFVEGLQDPLDVDECYKRAQRAGIPMDRIRLADWTEDPPEEQLTALRAAANARLAAVASSPSSGAVASSPKPVK